MKFHETLKGRWLSTRNILVTARLILAGDFWWLIQKKKLVKIVSVMMTSSGFVYDEHGFQNSTAFANDFQSEAATLRLHLNRCSYTFVVLSI